MFSSRYQLFSDMLMSDPVYEGYVTKEDGSRLWGVDDASVGVRWPGDKLTSRLAGRD